MTNTNVCGERPNCEKFHGHDDYHKKMSSSLPKVVDSSKASSAPKMQPDPASFGTFRLQVDGNTDNDVTPFLDPFYPCLKWLVTSEFTTEGCDLSVTRSPKGKWTVDEARTTVTLIRVGDNEVSAELPCVSPSRGHRILEFSGTVLSARRAETLVLEITHLVRPVFMLSVT